MLLKNGVAGDVLRQLSLVEGSRLMRKTDLENLQEFAGTIETLNESDMQEWEAKRYAQVAD